MESTPTPPATRSTPPSTPVQKKLQKNPNSSTPSTKSKEDETLEACLRLLAGSKDESVLAGLLLVAKHVSTSHFAQNRERIFGAMKGRSFLMRLLCGAKSNNKGPKDDDATNNTEAFRAISLSVSAFFCGDSALAARSFRDFVPLWLGLLADILSAEPPTNQTPKNEEDGAASQPPPRAVAMVEDLLICLHGAIAGDSSAKGGGDPRAASCAEACVDHNAGSLLVQLACATGSNSDSIDGPKKSTENEEEVGENSKKSISRQERLREFDTTLASDTISDKLEWPLVTRIHALQVFLLLHHHAPKSSVRRLTPTDGAMLCAWLSTTASASSNSKEAKEKVTTRQEFDVVGVANLLGMLLGRERMLHQTKQHIYLQQQSSHDAAAFAAFQKFAARTTAEMLLRPSMTDDFRTAVWVLTVALCEHCGQAWARFPCVQSLMRRKENPEPDTTASAAPANATKGSSNNTTKPSQNSPPQEERSFVSVLMRLVAVEITVRLSDTRFICLQSSLMPEDRRDFQSSTTGEQNTATAAATFSRAMAVTPLCFSVLRHAIRFLTNEPDQPGGNADSLARWDTLPWSSLKHVQSAIDEAVTSFAEFAEVARDVMDVIQNSIDKNSTDGASEDLKTDKNNNEYSLEELSGARMFRFRRLCVSGSDVLLTWLKENAGSDDSSIERIQQKRTRDLVVEVLPWMVSLQALGDVRGGEANMESKLACEWDLVISALLSATEEEEEKSARVCTALLTRNDALLRLAESMTAYVQQVTAALSLGSNGSIAGAAFSADKLVAFAFRAIDVGKVLLVLSLSEEKGCATIGKATSQAGSSVAADQLCARVKILLETHLESKKSINESFPVTGLDAQLTKQSVFGIVAHMLALSLWLSFGCVQSAGGIGSVGGGGAGVARSCTNGLGVLRRLCAHITKHDYAEVAEVKDELLPLIEMSCQRRI